MSTMSSFRRNKHRGKKRKNKCSTRSMSLEDKVRDLGGRDGFVLENASETAGGAKSSGLNGSTGLSATKMEQPRRFGLSEKIVGPSNLSNSSASFKQRSYPQSGHNSAKTIRSHSTKINSATEQNSTHVVCAVSENLAKETCVASLDAASPVSLHVVKQGNGQTYAETLAYLEILQPHEILLNEGRRNSHLAQKISSLFGKCNIKEIPVTRGTIKRKKRSLARGNNEDSQNELSGPCDSFTVVKFVPRSFFDQTKGAEILRQISRPDTYDVSVVEEYILLSSSHAVLQYIQLCLGANFRKNCLRLSVHAGGRSRMAIDRSSLLHLELLANIKTGKTANSLIGTIDFTKTTVGSRMLRSNLMAPPTDIDTINTRLDLVDTLSCDEAFFYAVMDHLNNLPDINRMLAGIALSPWKRGEGSTVTHRIASKGISALVCIKTALSALPAFSQILQDQLKTLERLEQSSHQLGSRKAEKSYEDTIADKSSLLVGLGEASTYGGITGRHAIRNHHLLRAIIHVMRHPDLDEVLATVTDVFNDGTAFTRKAESMRHQECFALKAKTDGMLDVIRHTFLANCDDIYRLADEYAETYDIRVTVKYSTARGYILAIPADLAGDIPDIFIQPVKAGRFINCSTQEVDSLNARAQDSIQDLLLLTHEHVQEVLDFAREKYDALASLSDAVALLDLCHSFADNVASSRLPWSRPVVSNGGDLTIRNGRYSIDVPYGLASQESQESPSQGQYIPNHTYAPGHRNFVVLTGANGSGKSTYLKQLAIICILAHCGSYVPAEKAIIPIRNMLCTRIGIADDQEHNISTFMLEMKDTAFICRNAGPKSIILIDELGRATSNEDGVAIAWAVSEFLRKKQSLTFFVTHYPQLTKLAEVYPGFQNQHMGAHLSKDGSSIFYSHRLRNGPCELSSDYGIEISSSCGWPQDVVVSAREVRSQIEELLPDCSGPIVAPSNELEDGRRCSKALKGICNRLKELFNESDNTQLRKNLHDSWQSLIADGGQNLLSSLLKKLSTSKHDILGNENTKNKPKKNDISMHRRGKSHETNSRSRLDNVSSPASSCTSSITTNGLTSEELDESDGS